jgi:hypothetical protein
MAKFFVGQRVRLIATDADDAKPYVGSETWIVGTVFCTYHREECWELANSWSVVKSAAGDFLAPILDSHEPAERDFTESLDKLLSEVRHASVE